MKISKSLSLVFLFLLFIHPSFAQTITKKKGKLTTYYPDGKKESSGKVKNFKKQGAWKYWDENEKIEKSITYKDDKKNGLCTEYYPSGNKKEEGNYSNDKQNGEWKGWYEGNVLAYDIHFDNGGKTGIQKYWYTNGQLYEEQKFTANVMDYDWTWFDNGRLRSSQYYKNGLKEGIWRTYADPKESSDTLPLSIDNFSSDKRNGLHLAYTHGKLSEEIMYKDDKLNGTYKKWDTNGMLGISEIYVDGNREGLCKYYNHGKCIREAMYSKGKINGEEREFDTDNGNLFRISWYKEGRIDSTKNYHPNGQLSILRAYSYYPGFVKTEEFSDYTEWDPQGNLLLKGTYHFESKDKTWTTFYPDKKIKSITPYSNGKISGVYKKWYANGKELIEMQCDGNTVTTAPKVWDEKGNAVKAGTKKYQEIVDSSKPGEIYNDPKKYKENRTALPDEPAKDETHQAVQGRAGMGNSTQQNGDGNPMPEYPDRSTSQANGDSAVFTYAEEMPEFPGGESAMAIFIQDNLKYPAIEKNNSMQGTVYVQFIVEKNGLISNVSIAKSVQGAPGFDKAAIQVISIMPDWHPGKMNGRPVRVRMIEPVRFVLQ